MRSVSLPRSIWPLTLRTERVSAMAGLLLKQV
jgi:hypothetical protein